MGCKNCNGTISQTTQLPPGCDSIQAITTNVTSEGATVVTITFCTGAVQQFTIPAPQNGEDGSNGTNGTDGANGVGIEDITVVQDGDEVTLTITLENGEEFNITFTLPTVTGAYIVQHLSQGTVAPEITGEFATLELHNLTDYFSIIKGTIPAGTVVNPGDTIHWDAVFNITGNLQEPHGVFKEFVLAVGSNDGIADAQFNLTGQPELINLYPNSTMSVHVNVEMSRTNSPTRDEMYLKGSMHVLDKGDNIHFSHSSVDLNPPQTEIETVAFYNLVPFTFGVENYIQLIGQSGGYGGDTINIDPIYMAVTKIPKL